MRIRRRPPPQPSSSPNPDPSLQPPPKEERASGGLHQPDGDLPDPLLQTLHPQHNTLEVLKEEKIQVLDDSSSQQTLSYMRAQGSERAGSAAEAPFGVGGLAWCKRKKRGSPVLMEGSRCSRVNGRGWRCCQQTLVGYSLCEHHLGKGRLRSMSSVRGTKLSGAAAAAAAAAKHKNIVIDGASAAAKQEVEEQCLGGNKGSKKKKKIGTMKARSISTLLDETDHAAAAIISSLAVPVLEIDKGLA